MQVVVPAETLSVDSSVDDDSVPLPSVDQRYLSDKLFRDFDISPNSKRALAEVLKYERCSMVQAASIPVCLGSEDVIAKAKTGTGKTLAFIVPTIEKVLSNRAPRGKVSALVLSPTRELARQIQAETHKMLTFHPELSSMVVYGGVDVKKNIRAIKERTPDILIATPGRCWDIMTQTQDPFISSLMGSTRVLVLDEADNLLDMGFRPQISKILGSLPPTTQRQTYLFSATFPADVKSLADVALKRKHSYVDAVGEDVATHTHVDASSLVVGKGELPMQLLGLLAKHMAQEPDYKIIVFLPTANLTAFYASAFAAAGLGGVVEMHSRMSQPQRDRASANFRAGSKLVMFSSDVSARGVDYPNVTYVVQLGAPSNREQYIHRAGRTGRAGRSGQCTLLLADFERPFLDRLKDLPMQQLQPCNAQLPEAAVASGAVSPALARDPAAALQRAAAGMGYASRARAYQSFLGYYKSHEVIKMPAARLVQTANEYAAELLACPTPPPLEARTVGKMGLKGVPGVVVGSRPDEDTGGQQGTQGGRGRAPREERPATPAPASERASAPARGRRDAFPDGERDGFREGPPRQQRGGGFRDGQGQQRWQGRGQRGEERGSRQEERGSQREGQGRWQEERGSRQEGQGRWQGERGSRQEGQGRWQGERGSRQDGQGRWQGERPSQREGGPRGGAGGAGGWRSGGRGRYE